MTDPHAAPLVIAHRGASGYLPEHTLAAYELAIQLGADFIEPDLVSTSDGVLVARHENEISLTTDVASHPEFADRRTTKLVDDGAGGSITGWFTEDFTLAELKTLRAHERIPALRPDNTTFNGRYDIPTLGEIIELARRYRGDRRRIGIYPETKHPRYFASIGLPLEPALVDELRRHGLTGAEAPVFLQSFDPGSLRALREQVDVPLIQLLRERDPAPDLTGIAEYAAGIGPAKELIVPHHADGSLAEPTQLVEAAHAAGLVVHPFTFRAENSFRPRDFRNGPDPAAHGDLARELTMFYALGVDGVFCDFPDTAVAARIRYLFSRASEAARLHQATAAAS